MSRCRELLHLAIVNAKANAKLITATSIAIATTVIIIADDLRYIREDRSTTQTS